MVLNAICDDYENVDQVILRDVAETEPISDLRLRDPKSSMH